LQRPQGIALQNKQKSGKRRIKTLSFFRSRFSKCVQKRLRSKIILYIYRRKYQQFKIVKNWFYNSNNRAVINEFGVVRQVTNYYPFGGVFSTTAYNSGDDLQPYKYNGKELDRTHGLDWYDYGARNYDAFLPMFTSLDPHCESYYNVSPYAYCHNNPVILIDPDGMDDYYSVKGKLLYHDDNNSNIRFVIKNRDDKRYLKKVNKNGGFDAAKLEKAPYALPNDAALNESLKILDDTKSNDDGLAEHCALVSDDGKTVEGEKGEVWDGVSDVATAKLPSYPEYDRENAKTTSIHSHITGVKNEMGSQADAVGPGDPDVFRQYKCNIIVGKKGLGPGYRRDVICFYGRNVSKGDAPVLILTPKAVKRILGIK